jgi:hypothetical protein
MTGSSPFISGSSGPPPAAEPSEAVPAPEVALAVGDAVRLVGVPSYLKTADPMPMLRPSDLVDGEEIGQVVEVRAFDQFAVRFRRGAFLLGRVDLSPVEPPEQGGDRPKAPPPGRGPRLGPPG